ncbi:MAG: NAD-dependent deacylase [Bacteroidales bacterium]|nr:NAD-dependent deacylase [Bacteroidales bacterium]
MVKKKIAVLTGAGVSAESGLGTFRDNGGLWDKYDPQEVASIDGYYRNRALVLEFYNLRRKELSGARPNSAHRDIAAMEEKNIVTVITQNVDNLHEKAGSTNVIHLHGELTKVRPEVGVYDDTFSEKEVIDVRYDEVNLGDKAPNGSQLRPHIVFFGEAVPKIDKAIDVIGDCDVLLIVGTSLSVYPAAGLYRYAKSDTPIYVIDPKDIPIRGGNIHHIKATATEGMQEFLKIIETLN